MYQVEARNINEAYALGLEMLRDGGQLEETRAGKALVMNAPVVHTFMSPTERVLMAPGRTGNPVFHAMAAIWMLAGGKDARWLDRFVKDFSSRFAEDDGHLHGAYGHRLRYAFHLNHSQLTNDQLDMVVNILRENPDSRQAVLQLWSAALDLGADTRDRPCNLMVALRMRRVGIVKLLDITVFNRSNDAIWGLYGENHVQFGFLQEYLAARIGCEVGWYYHVSNNFHAYTDVLDKQRITGPADIEQCPYHLKQVKPMQLVSNPEMFDKDCRAFIHGISQEPYYFNDFFNKVLVPMWNKDYDSIEADDWSMACYRWRNQK